MKKRLSLFLTILATLIQSTFLPFSPVTAAEACKDIEIVFADGSGAKIGGTDENYNDFRTAVDNVLAHSGFSYHFYELGSKKQGVYQYPAEGIGIESLKNIITTLGAFISAGESYAYGESVNQGVGEVRTYVRKISEQCPNTKFILSGFSQGAGVISEAITTIDSEKIIYVATFGDAKLYLPEGFGGITSPACRGKNLSPYREYVPDCAVYQGILQGRIPYQPAGYEGKLGVWCNYHDMICSSYINWFNFSDGADPHGSYGNYYNQDHIYEKAADTIFRKVLIALGRPVTEKFSKQNVAILIDSTGSMSGVINSYKQEALRLATEVLNNNGSVALYEYRDTKNENFEPKLHCDFSACSLEKFQSELGTISVSGGGDTPESVLSASLNAMEELKWQRGATKSIIVLTDAGYHPSDIFRGNPITLKDVVDKSLTIDPVNIYTITPSDKVSEYADLVSQTSGKSFTLGELDFSTDFVLGRPDVKLSAEIYRGEAGNAIFFDASNTISAAEIVKYEWDIDGDGVFETTSTEPFVTKVYDIPTEKIIQVKATDKNGMFGTMSAKVEIDPRTDKGELPEITNLSYQEIDGSKILVKFQTDAFRTIVVVNDTVVGVTDKQELTINDLNFYKDNSIVLIPYNRNGFAGERRSFNLDKKEFVVPKTPNCGQK